MTTLPIAYIAAPFAARTKRGRVRNTLRAIALGKLAHRTGFAPIVVHPSLERLYGDDGDAPARRAGLAANCAIVDGIAALAESEIWVLALTKTPQSVRITDGCRAEVETWQLTRGGQGLRLETWAGFADLAARFGMADEWARLAPRPGRQL